MRLPEYVTWRGNVLVYRRAYPKELWPATGRAPFQKSLRTADIREAQRARPGAEREYQAKVDAARAELARRVAALPLTKDAARMLAVHWFVDALELADQFADLIRGPEELADAVEDSEWGQAEARRALAEGDLRDKQRLARCLREQARFGPQPEAEALLVRLLARAAIAAGEVHTKRLRGRYGAMPQDPLFASALREAERFGPEPAPGVVGPSPPPHNETPKETVGDLEAAYRAERFPDLRPSTRLAYGPVFRVLRETLGADKALPSITREDGRRLLTTIQSIPANANKRAELKGLSVRAQIAEGKRLALPTLSAKTVADGYLAHLKTLFRFAEDRGWMHLNPAKGLTVRDDVAPQDKREPFRDRLPALFGAAPWKPRDASGGGEPVRYWGPLLALFHGLRRGEIAGLRVSDVGREQGEPMLYIRAHERALKGRGSRRDMPVHPELQRLGFMAFVAARKKAGGDNAQLFESEKPNARGQWGRRFGEWFVKRVRELGLKGRKLSLHALRHDFRDALREGGVDEGLADYLTGHARQGVAGIYGGQRPYSVARLKEAVGKVRYPGLRPPAQAAIAD
jgi:integrase